MLFGTSLYLPASISSEHSSLSSGSNSRALVGAKAHPSPTEKPIVNGVVLVIEGKIKAVGKSEKIKVPGDVERINCAGSTLIAAFWNSHIHLAEAKWQNISKIPARQFPTNSGRLDRPPAA